MMRQAPETENDVSAFFLLICLLVLGADDRGGGWDPNGFPSGDRSGGWDPNW